MLYKQLALSLLACNSLTRVCSALQAKHRRLTPVCTRTPGETEDEKIQHGAMTKQQGMKPTTVPGKTPNPGKPSPFSTSSDPGTVEEEELDDSDRLEGERVKDYKIRKAKEAKNSSEATSPKKDLAQVPPRKTEPNDHPSPKKPNDHPSKTPITKPSKNPINQPSKTPITNVGPSGTGAPPKPSAAAAVAEFPKQELPGDSMQRLQALINTSVSRSRFHSRSSRRAPTRRLSPPSTVRHTTPQPAQHETVTRAQPKNPERAPQAPKQAPKHGTCSSACSGGDTSKRTNVKSPTKDPWWKRMGARAKDVVCRATKSAARKAGRAASKAKKTFKSCVKKAQGMFSLLWRSRKQKCKAN